MGILIIRASLLPERTNKWMNELVNKWMTVWMNRWTDECMIISRIIARNNNSKDKQIFLYIFKILLGMMFILHVIYFYHAYLKSLRKDPNVKFFKWINHVKMTFLVIWKPLVFLDIRYLTFIVVEITQLWIDSSYQAEKWCLWRHC